MSSPLSSNIVRRGKPFSLEGLLARSRNFRLQSGVLLFLLLANLLFALIFVTPVYRQKVSQETALQSARSRVGQLLQYQKAQEAFLSLEKTMLTQQELAMLAGRLPSIAKRHQLMLPGVSYQTEKQKGGEARKIALDFRLNGRYADIRKFIHEVEGLDLFLYIQGMGITSSDKDSERIELQMTMVALLR